MFTDKQSIIRNPNTSWKDIKDTCENLNDVMRCSIMTDINISFEDVQANPNYRWDYRYLATNPYFFDSIKDKIEEFSQCFSEYERSYHNPLRYLSENPNFTWNIIIDRPLSIHVLHWHEISRNGNITWEIISSNLHLPWKWSMVLRNPNVTWENIESHKNLLLSLKSCNAIWWYNFSWNPNLTYEIVKNHPNISWKWYFISNNKFKKHPVLVNKMKKMYRDIITKIE